MSKRKAPEPAGGGGKAAGKRRAEQELDADDGLDMLGDGADLTEMTGGIDSLADAMGEGGEGGEEEFDDQDDLLGAMLGADDVGDDDGDDGDDDGGEPAPPEGPALPEPAEELPDGVTQEQLSGDETVDLTACGELSLAEARRVAMVLATNDALTTVKVGSSELAVGDLKEDEELEWDSEEYTDIEAIIIAELLKANTTVSRLDLARNQIADAGACALALMLEQNKTLEYLNLESNTFGERGGDAFLAALAKNESVQYLNLMYNSVPTSIQGAMRQAWQASSRGVGLHL